jgi:hypothetical protein
VVGADAFGKWEEDMATNHEHADVNQGSLRRWGFL